MVMAMTMTSRAGEAIELKNSMIAICMYNLLGRTPSIAESSSVRKEREQRKNQ